MSSQPLHGARTVPTRLRRTGGDDDQHLTWSEVEDRLRDAPNYWLSTVTPGGRPHTRPVDGVWVDGALVFGGSPDTRWVRNMQTNPAISIHLSGDDDVVILDGTVELVVEREPSARPSRGRCAAGEVPAVLPIRSADAVRPSWMLCPTVAYAWSLTGFPKQATRWTFDR